MAVYKFKKDKNGIFWKFIDGFGPDRRWEDRFGNRHPFVKGDFEKFEIYEAESFKDFTWTDAYLQKTLDCGWIDREGHFWGCKYMNHDQLVEHVLKKTTEEVERLGWIKVNNQAWLRMGKLHNITPEQSQTLERIGRFADDPLYRDPSITFEKAFPNGYKPYLSYLPENKERRVEPRQPRPESPGGHSM